MSWANNFEEILTEFEKSKVEFMLAGGYAVNYHGYNRSTSDLDIWVKPTEENKVKIKFDLLKIRFTEAGLAELEKLDFTKPFVFHADIIF